MVFTAVLAALAVGVFNGCGTSQPSSSSSSTPTIVARVGATPVTMTSLTHWTTTFIRGDYYSIVNQKAPDGLATNPPDYQACAQASKQIPPLRSEHPLHLTTEQREAKCKQLYRVTQLEALSYLLSALWSQGQAAEQGYHATSQEVQQGISRLYTRYQKLPGGYHSFLTGKGWTQSDLTYIMLRDLLNAAVMKTAKQQANQQRNPVQTLERILASNVIHWRAKTTCQPNYIVLQCKQYNPNNNPTTSPSIIIEELATSNH
jgi:hypothetical protein